MTYALEFHNVSKRYVLGEFRGGLREAVPNLVSTLMGRNGTGAPPELWALRDVSFQVGPGETLGIIGPNGAGKTTILKLATFITQPTSGQVTARGRTSALIELGAGFHPDLTGRENIYLNGTILGLKRHEIQQRFDEIVDFSGLERFLDTPVKRYSSGMYCRLGFAVAAYVNPDILFVDEVLAVGDAAFQAKCLKRMSELKAEGTAIVFVTHNLGYLQRLCNRAIFLYQGKVLEDGPVGNGIQAYRNHPAYSTGGQEQLLEPACDSPTGSTEASSHSSSGFSPIVITKVYCSDGHGMRVANAQTGASLTVHVRYHAFRPTENANFEIWLYGLDGTEYASFATAWDGQGPLSLNGSGEVHLHIDPLCLMPGTYFVQVAISDKDGLVKYDIHWDRHKIVVLSGPISYGLLYQPHQWLIDRTQTD